MRYRIDPKSGNALSVLGFGCMRFPRGFTAQIHIDKTEKLILSAIERGVNYFDTAYAYGGSEEALGTILHRNNAREKIFIATKLPFQLCESPGDFDSLFSTHLERLKTGHIDYYLMHNISETALWQKLCSLGIEGWIAGKKASGQIRQIGFSFHGAQGEFLSLLDAYDWDFCQIQYNYMNVRFQAGQVGLRKAHAKGLPVVIMEPLLGGRLAHGVPAKAVKLFREADSALSPAAWALRWLWNQPEVSVVLSGMSSPEQLEENLNTAQTAEPGALSEKEAAVFEPVAAVFQEAYKIPCTGCNYCMPCPQKVNIPGCFAAYNASYAVSYMTGLHQYVTGTGAINVSPNYGGRSCVKCGKCERQCPQRIGIMRSLEAVARRMEPWWVRALLALFIKILRRRK